MKKLMFLVLLLAVGLAGYGFYAGWFAVTTETTPDGKSNTTLTVDRDKIRADEQKAKDKLKEVGGQVRDKASQTVNTIKAN